LTTAATKQLKTWYYK